jgi:hypothetical protein
LQHPDLTVTSEEKVLNAIVMYGMKAKELFGWEAVDQLIINSKPEVLFGERLQLASDLFPFVRFPLLQYSLLEKVCMLFIQTLWAVYRKIEFCILTEPL